MVILKVDNRGRISLKKWIQGIMPEYFAIDEQITGEIILTPIYDLKTLRKGAEKFNKIIDQSKKVINE